MIFCMRLIVQRSFPELFTRTHSTSVRRSIEMVIDTGGFSDTSIQPEELASQSVRLKEEQLRREEEKVGCYSFQLTQVFS
jgi:hypothetical protein